MTEVELTPIQRTIVDVIKADNPATRGEGTHAITHEINIMGESWFIHYQCNVSLLGKYSHIPYEDESYFSYSFSEVEVYNDLAELEPELSEWLLWELSDGTFENGQNYFN